MEVFIRAQQSYPALQPPVEQARLINSAVRLLEAFQSGCLTLQKLQHGGTQRAEVRYQQVNGAEGGYSVVTERVSGSRWGSANIKAGDEIVISIAEHYSNLLPWRRLAESAGAALRVADVDDEGRLTPDRIAAVLSKRTKLVAFSHVSNVLGYINDVRELTATAKQVGATVVVDGAQGVPHVNVDVQSLGCDFCVFSGHKMLGPMGTGVVWGRRSLLDAMPPYHVGSNMAHDVTATSATLERGALKYQAGTPDVAAQWG